MRPLSQLRDSEQQTLATAGLIPPPPPRHGDPGNHDYRPVCVKVKLFGGNSGSLTTPCTYTYDVWRGETPDAVVAGPTAQQITTFRLATQKTPQKLRSPFGRYIAAATASWGEAVYDFNSAQWLLLVAFGEREAANECDQ